MLKGLFHQITILDFQSFLVMNILRNDTCIINNNEIAHFEKKFMLLQKILKNYHSRFLTLKRQQ